MLRVDAADTIAAISSPPGPAQRGLVRLSGSRAWEIALTIFRPEAVKRRSMHAKLVAGTLTIAGLRPLVKARAAFWPGPKTYTGEELAEIHLVGCEPILNLLLADILTRGARLAEPGEFTLRAFLNGKLDLTRAEAVLGVIDARSETQVAAALHQLAGGIATPIQALRDRVLDLLAHLEAGLDFVDEPDVNPLERSALADELSRAAIETQRIADQMTGRDRPDSLPRVVLVGPPNAGKSSLFNALAAEYRALVSPIAGTTRDYLSARVDCDGIDVELIDTIGIESASTPIEAEAQSLRAMQMSSSDLLLECSPANDPFSLDEIVAADVKRIRVQTKVDLATEPLSNAVATSVSRGQGLDTLRKAIATRLRDRAGEDSTVGVSSARCRDSLAAASAALASAAATLELSGGDELVAIDLRQALDGLGRVIGDVVNDDILDRIFRRFCIGK